MPLKVVLFDFNGVILDDEPIHEQLIQEVMLSENVRITPEDFQKFCLGRSDRACLQDLFNARGRVVSPDYIGKLLVQKTAAYQQRLQTLEALPLFADVESLIQTFQERQIKLGIVSGALRAEIEWVLERATLRDAFGPIVAAEDISTSKPSPEGYEKAIAQFNHLYPNLNLQPQDCLAIEDSFPGLEAARAARIPVVGVAHTYPFHMMQRRSNWAVDNLGQLEIPRLIQVFEGGEAASSTRSEEPVPAPQRG
ncbi:HAD family hydrolase [Altericista sp. CCNU0014]|uniref:HAD family hydrolase n=1 Tax=Altericista sp. CCNU0014 TaxID=3082949 RepID=UPI00384F5D5B